MLSKVLSVGVGNPDRRFEALAPAVDRFRRCLSAADISRQADASATILLPAQAH